LKVRPLEGLWWAEDPSASTRSAQTGRRGSGVWDGSATAPRLCRSVAAVQRGLPGRREHPGLGCLTSPRSTVETCPRHRGLRTRPGRTLCSRTTPNSDSACASRPTHIFRGWLRRRLCGLVGARFGCGCCVAGLSMVADLQLLGGGRRVGGDRFVWRGCPWRGCLS
jgi:hypothetical protein